jgi:predicted nucleotide-binding protein
MRKIATWIEQKGHKPLTWDTPSLFPPGVSIFQSLINISKSEGLGGAILIFNEDDKVWHKDAEVKQPRDNVLIEYGLFVGALGPNKAIICKHASPKTASDIQGIVYIDVSPTNENAAREELENWLDTLQMNSALV